jgi:hypothetical protein
MKLEAIPGFFEDLEDKWNQTYAILLRYYTANGRIPTQKTMWENVRIGAWVTTQRNAAKGTSTGLMTSERKAKLEAVPGFFEDLGSPEDKWNRHYAVLLRYYTTNGRIPTQRTVWENINIGNWVLHQREAAKGKRVGLMPPARKAKLEAIPGFFVTLDSTEDRWNKTYAVLLRYCTTNGILPPQTEKWENAEIGKWISKQRLAAKGKDHRRMTLERRAKLEALPGWHW